MMSYLDLKASNNECSQFEDPQIVSAHLVKASYSEYSCNEAL